MDKSIEERLDRYLGKPLPMKFQEVNGPFPVVTEVENWEEEEVDEELVKLVLDNFLTDRLLSIVEADLAKEDPYDNPRLWEDNY